jgi:hypothetical protein
VRLRQFFCAGYQVRRVELVVPDYHSPGLRASDHVLLARSLGFPVVRLHYGGGGLLAGRIFRASLARNEAGVFVCGCSSLGVCSWRMGLGFAVR